MAGEAKEITFHLPDGYSPVDNGLSSVYQDQYAPFVGFSYNTVHVRAEACHVGHGRDGNQSGAAVHLIQHTLRPQAAVCLCQCHTELRAFFLTLILPGKIVGGMFQLSDNYIISRADICLKYSRGSQID